MGERKSAGPISSGSKDQIGAAGVSADLAKIKAKATGSLSGITDLPASKAAIDAAPKVTPRVVQELRPEPDGEDLKKKELIDRATEMSGAKRRDVKVAIEAALDILGETLGEGRGVALPGLGRMRVTRIKPSTNGHNLIVRIRQNGTQASVKSDGGGDDGDTEPKSTQTKSTETDRGSARTFGSEFDAG